MSIVGVGMDVVEVARVRHLVERGGRRFLERWLLPPEVEFCLFEGSAAQRMATLFAAKEATLKSLGAPGGGHLPWRHIEVTHSPRPGILLSGSMQELASVSGVSTFHLSMSHATGYAVASVVAMSDFTPPLAGG